MRWLSAWIVLLSLLPASAADLVKGSLDNGLTYFVLRNAYPPAQCEFYLAQRVGSILEQDGQRGLAHFLEHMAFNGTRHFPGHELHRYLEGLGVRWGWDFNAYTGVDQTVYNISRVPLTRPSVADSCLLVLRDWACDLTLDPAEIDAERAVIHEEWRRGGREDRLLAQLVPMMYPHSRYGQRLPIGLMSVVDSFPHQELRDYYRSWYRPDLQAVIVVGDIDADSVARKIRTMFGSIPMPENAPRRADYTVPDHRGTITATASDPEQQLTEMWLYFHVDSVNQQPRGTVQRMVMDYVNSRAEQMLNARLREAALDAASPFTDAGVSFGQTFMAQNKDALWSGMTAKKGREAEAVQAFYRELLRAARHGFTPDEYDRARADYRAAWDRYYANRDKTENSTYVSQYVDNFLHGDTIMSIEQEYAWAKEMMDNITLADINGAFAIAVGPGNRVLALRTPQDAEPIDALALLAQVDEEVIAPYEERRITSPLIAELPEPGKVVNEGRLEEWDAVEWTLANGARVVARQTDWMPEEIAFRAVAQGGWDQLAPDSADDVEVKAFPSFPVAVGDYSSRDLDKWWLTGKEISLQPGFGSNTRTLTGSTTPADLESLMQLLHASMTEARLDSTEFEAARQNAAARLQASWSDPGWRFYELAARSTLPRSRRSWLATARDMERADRQKMERMARGMTANAADFTFYFVGNVDLPRLRSLAERYIGSLPGSRSTARLRAPAPDLGAVPLPGRVEVSDSMPMPTPMTYALVDLTASQPVTLGNMLATRMLAHILSTRLNADIREQMGATYAIAASDLATWLPRRNLHLQTVTTLRPEMAREALEGIERIVRELPQTLTRQETEAAREYLSKDFAAGSRRNAVLAKAMGDQRLTGLDAYNGFGQALRSITPEGLRRLMRQFVDEGNQAVVVLAPKP